MYNGDLLPDCYDDWILPHREQMIAAALTATKRLVTLYEARRDYQAARNTIRRWLELDPCDEQAAQAFLRLAPALGERADAVRLYQLFVARLHDSLGVEPGAELQRAYAQLRATPIHTTVPRQPLVGRFAAWETAQRALETARQGAAMLLLIRGESGIGKTRLAEELLAWAEQSGWSAASARCYAAEGAPAYGPIIDWLQTPNLRVAVARLDARSRSEVARVAPALAADWPQKTPPATPLSEPWQLRRLLESLTRALLAPAQPTILLLDDVQWCDSDSLALLQFLFRSHANAPLLLAATLRSGEQPNYRLNDLCMALERSGCAWEIDLPPLSRAETATLGAQTAHRPLNAAQAERLFVETEGNPLFIVELVRAVLDTHQTFGARLEPDDMLHTPLSPTVTRVIERRLQHLSQASRDLLAQAAVLGRAFSIPALQVASNTSDHAILDMLDDLWQRQILRERNPHTYDFSHDKIRAVLYNQLSPPRRRFFHQRAAEALAVLEQRNLHATNGKIAFHYDRAGMPAEAIISYRRAAADARAILANDEALMLLQRARQLAEFTDVGQFFKIALETGPLLLHQGAFDAAGALYQHALCLTATGDPITRARLLHAIGLVASAQKRGEATLLALEQAQQTLEEAPRRTTDWWTLWIDIQLARSQALYWIGNWEDALPLLQTMHALVEQYGTVEQRIEWLNALSRVHFRRDRFRIGPQTVALRREAYLLRQGVGGKEQRVCACFELGFALLWHGDLQEAEHLLGTALEIAARAKNVHDQAQFLAYLVITKRLRGCLAEVEQLCEQLQAHATTIGDFSYVAVALACRSWAAWRLGCGEDTRTHGTAALEAWRNSPVAYPFQWLAAWPLLAHALAHRQTGAALEYARLMLDIRQQQFPWVLESSLLQALRVAETGDTTAAHALLAQACEIAQTIAYL